MNKRRRTSSVASRGTEDDGDDIPPEPTKRRKKLDPVSVCMCVCASVYSLRIRLAGLY